MTCNSLGNLCQFGIQVAPIPKIPVLHFLSCVLALNAFVTSRKYIVEQITITFSVSATKTKWKEMKLLPDVPTAHVDFQATRGQSKEEAHAQGNRGRNNA